MTIPDYESLMMPVLNVLADGKQRSLASIRDQIAKTLGVTDEERKECLPSGPKKFDNRVGWARQYLLKAGLIEKVERGVFVITEAGLAVIDEGHKRIDRHYLMKYPSFRRYMNKD